MNDAYVYMNGGKIIGNKAKVNGGGVNFYNNKYEMNGGTISYNTAETGRDGGICLINEGEIYLFGGSICNNTASSQGALSALSYPSIYVGGTIKIYDNVNNGEISKDESGNYKLTGGTKCNAWINLNNLSLYTHYDHPILDGMSIGISIDPASADVRDLTPFIGGLEGDFSSNFFADNGGDGDYIKFENESLLLLNYTGA